MECVGATPTVDVMIRLHLMCKDERERGALARMCDEACEQCPEWEDVPLGVERLRLVEQWATTTLLCLERCCGAQLRWAGGGGRHDDILTDALLPATVELLIHGTRQWWLSGIEQWGMVFPPQERRVRTGLEYRDLMQRFIDRVAMTTGPAEAFERHRSPLEAGDTLIVTTLSSLWTLLLVACFVDHGVMMGLLDQQLASVERIADKRYVDSPLGQGAAARVHNPFTWEEVFDTTCEVSFLFNDDSPWS